MNDRDNDHVTVLELRGFVADDLHSALSEAYAISKATRCKQFLFSLSLNPPIDHVATDEELLEAANRAEQKLDLDGQPRAVVIHEKKGRRHAHVVWSRIDVETMTAINLPHYKLKMRDLSRDLFLEHDWNLPDGLKTYGQKDPLNFSLSEWQQAQRIGVDAREMKQLFQAAWAQSDDLTSLKNALSDKGLYLAKGDRRGVVALDIQGHVYALAKWTGIRTKEVKARLGDAHDLQSVDETKASLHAMTSQQMRKFISDAKELHSHERRPLQTEKLALVAHHRAEREMLFDKQKERWQREVKDRLSQLNGGIRGIWDRITGARSTVLRQNEREALACVRRDQMQRDRLVVAQLKERRTLQKRFERLKVKQTQERRILARDVSSILNQKLSLNKSSQVASTHSREHQRGALRKRGFSLG
ncbi:relaxase/mobilization nuclease domain-containing protein [Roseobacter sp.]|uniref:relaxase/mobilization nuclease domain-containing protein n=1 Tax=Roseobacter sp. TaxID=1907202 RepID=UPI0029675109|nr:relaxase/mobilization nuclease domain-containing protein [Roseobacter sp.]MDW3181648.1 relaxase/mobilization nuclease domain-containing protein [Roseobacter sp.]